MNVEVTNDFSMYYSGTYVTIGASGECVRVLGADADEQTVSVVNKGRKRWVLGVEDINFFQPSLGYRQVRDTVVLLSRRPRRTTKKSINEETIVKFYPQEEEYNYIRKPLPDISMFDIYKESFVMLKDIDKALDSKDAVVLTRYFAVVKKGNGEKPLLYYRDSAIGEYEGNGEFSPIGGNQLILNKLEQEVNNVWDRD